MEFQKLTKSEMRDHKFTEELVDHYWGSINYVSSLIKASEIKAGLILSFYGILLNFSYKFIEIILTSTPSKTLLFVLLGASFLCTLTSIYFSIRCFMPRSAATNVEKVFLRKEMISLFGSV